MKIHYRGFTLIELLVVISIALVLSLIVLSVVMEARKDARDSIRVAAAEQLALGIRLYKESEGEYPAYPGGVELGVGGAIDTQLGPFIKSIPKDPLGSTDDVYEYWFYPDFLCNGVRHDVVIVKSMERTENSNFEEVCGGNTSMQSTSPALLGLIPTAHAQLSGTGGSGGNNTGGSNSGSCSNNFLGSGGCPGSGSGSGILSACDLTFSPAIVQKTPTGNSQVTITWNPSSFRGRLNITGPQGCIYCPSTGDPSGIVVSIPNTTQVGTYSVNLNPTQGGYTQCTESFQVVGPSTQCNDRIDNDADGLIDSADPGCHVGGVLSGAYDPNDISEVNITVDPDYVQSAYGGTYTQAGYYSQATYPWGSTGGGAYIVFVN
jgi:prepilin-type N-terminal cleavage/methylation domain-containing protein